MADDPIKITPARAEWLRSVKAGNVALYFPWGGGSPYFVQTDLAGHKARDRGVLKRLQTARLIQDDGTVTGSRRVHPFTLTPAGTRALENHDA